jgi:replicative DNA helicase
MPVFEFKNHFHYSMELEAAALGAFMLEKHSFARVTNFLTPEVFYFDGNRTVYTAIKKMWDENIPIDIVTVTNFLVRNMQISEIGTANTAYYVTRLTNTVVSAANLEYHCFIMRQMYVEREIIKITQGGIDLSDGDAEQKVRKLQDELTKLMMAKVGNDWMDMSEVLLKLVDHMQKVKDKDLVGITTGVRQLDIVTGGFQPTNLVVIAARPSVGKSALLGKMVMAAAADQKKVGVISLEMPDIQVAARLSSLASEIDFWRIFRNRMVDEEQSRQLYSYFQAMADMPIYLSDKAQVNIGSIRAKAMKLKHKYGLDILFIDYLQLIEGDDNNNRSREQEIAKLSRGLKLLAMDLNIPIILLSQLNRKSEERGDKKPRLADLRESGAIEQDADGVILLHRDWMAGIKVNEEGHSTEHEADLMVVKWRNGELIDIKLGFDGAKMKFYEPDETTQSGYTPVITTPM